MSPAENFYSEDSCCGKVDMGNRELDNVKKAELKHLFDNSQRRMSSELFYHTSIVFFSERGVMVSHLNAMHKLKR